MKGSVSGVRHLSGHHSQTVSGGYSGWRKHTISVVKHNRDDFLVI